MIRYYFKTGLRAILKHKNVSFIGILSLSIGISVLFLITIFTRNELGMDSFHSNASNIYKLSYGHSSTILLKSSMEYHSGRFRQGNTRFRIVGKYYFLAIPLCCRHNKENAMLNDKKIAEIMQAYVG